VEIPARGTNAKYASLYTDRRTGFKIGFTIARKSDGPATVDTLSQTIHTLPAKTPIQFGPGTLIQGDNEMGTKPWLTAFERLKLVFQSCVPDTPEGNGYAERQWQTVWDAIRAVLHHYQLNLDLWARAFVHILYVLNRTPNATTGISPYENFTGHKPDIEYLRSLPAFGTPGAVNIQDHRTKLAPKARWGIFVGVDTHNHEQLSFWST
jgi:hypothetical protein